MASPIEVHGKKRRNFTMLRISESELTGHSIVLRLEGAIRGEWLVELVRVSSMHVAAGRSVQLDFSGVSTIDSAAAEFLERAAGTKISVIHASKILTELIEQQGDRNA